MSPKFALASTLIAVSLFAAALFAAEKYSGPTPPKTDVPYLVHASNLIETEVADGRIAPALAAEQIADMLR